MAPRNEEPSLLAAMASSSVQIPSDLEGEPVTSVVRLLADYDCYALWVASTQGYENVAPEALLISGELADAINEWSDQYDRTLNRKDPKSSGFASTDAERKFVDRGQVLADRLKAELGDSWTVLYYDQALKCDIEIN
jgi:hypothetical protein